MAEREGFDGRYKELYSDLLDRAAVCGGTLAVIRSLITEVRGRERTAKKACEEIVRSLAWHDEEIDSLERAAKERRRAAKVAGDE